MFKRVFPLAAAFLLGAIITWFWDREPTEDEPSGVHQSFAQAKAHYLNESNAEYRRARLTLEPFSRMLRDNVAFHLDMALIDLQETNHRIQGQGRLITAENDLVGLLLSARGHLERAKALDPDNESVAYNLARTYMKLARHTREREEYAAAAVLLLEPLAERDDADASALLLYGDLLREQGKYKEALAAYEKIIAFGSEFVPATLYFAAQNKAAKVLLRTDNAAGLELLKAIEREYGLDKPNVTTAAIERGRYTVFRELRESLQTFPDPRELNWHHVTTRANIPALGAKPFFAAPDLDGDCARDLVVNGKSGMRVLRNLANAQFEDKTQAAGFPLDFEIHAAAAGDFNGDGLCDLVVGGPKGLRLFLNITDAENKPKDWLFVAYDKLPDQSPAFARADEPVTTITLWDFDHDGTLDMFVGGPRNRLYRTTIEAPPAGGKYVRFDEMADKLGLGAPPAHDSLLLDVEEDHDVDLLISGPEGNAWFENLRVLSFAKRELPAGAGLEAGDVDNDLAEEVRIGSDVYKWTKAGWKKQLFAYERLLDLDTDGVIDKKPFAGMELPGKVLDAVGADLNRDDGGAGGRDLLLLTEQGLDLYLSTASRPMRWIEIRPRGYKTNEMGIGTKLKLWVGDLRIGTTCRDGLVSFGIGTRPSVDAAVWVRWSNGVEQGVVAPRSLACVDLEEREGEAGSCPFLYAFDGSSWRFVNDCHSGTPLGLPYADGKYLPPRSSETIMVPGDKVEPVDGKVRLDLCEELRELFYVDHVQLRAIDHPARVRPVLDEGFRVMSHPAFKVFGLGDLRPPRSAVDQAGRDVLALISKRDGRHAVVWEPLDSRYVGFAREWTIDLDFGDLSGASRVLLVMDGWVEFPTASSSIAVSRSRTVDFKMPEIEARTADGKWRKVAVEAGFPAGKGKAALVDLTGKLPEGSGRLRITSTLRLHWDAFQISTGEDQPMRLSTVPLVGADHKFRGIGERIDDPALEQPWTYSHDRLIAIYAFDQQPGGLLTPYGDVLDWISKVDDRYPIVAAGDVIELTFDASGLPPLARGWVRDYCFTTNGWVKDADPNQAVRDSVKPLPFRAMSGYPYDPSKEPYPHPDFEKKLTRPSSRLVEANQGPLK